MNLQPERHLDNESHIESNEESLEADSKDIKLISDDNILDLSNKELTTVQFLEFSRLEHMRFCVINSLLLRGNELADIKALQLPALGLLHLTKLDLSYNLLTESIPHNSLPKSLSYLDISGNGIDNLDGLIGCPHLRVVIASDNCLKSLGNLPSKLEEIDLSENLLSSVINFRLLSFCPNLRVVHVSGNPMSANQLVQCRATLISVLPNLKQIDDTMVSNSKIRKNLINVSNKLHYKQSNSKLKLDKKTQEEKDAARSSWKNQLHASEGVTDNKYSLYNIHNQDEVITSIVNETVGFGNDASSNHNHSNNNTHNEHLDTLSSPPTTVSTSPGWGDAVIEGLDNLANSHNKETKYQIIPRSPRHQSGNHNRSIPNGVNNYENKKTPVVRAFTNRKTQLESAIRLSLGESSYAMRIKSLEVSTQNNQKSHLIAEEGKLTKRVSQSMTDAEMRAFFVRLPDRDKTTPKNNKRSPNGFKHQDNIESSLSSSDPDRNANKLNNGRRGIPVGVVNSRGTGTGGVDSRRRVSGDKFSPPTAATKAVDKEAAIRNHFLRVSSSGLVDVNR